MVECARTQACVPTRSGTRGRRHDTYSPRALLPSVYEQTRSGWPALALPSLIKPQIWVPIPADSASMGDPQSGPPNPRCPICQAPQFPAPPLNPTKQTTTPPKRIWPTLHAINPQKRTIELVLRRANTMQENIRKIVEAARPVSGSEGTSRLSGARPPYPQSKPVHAALPSPKRCEKCRKSAQKHTGNHLPTSTPSTT